MAEHIYDMSLDEYIANFKAEKATASVGKRNNINESKFKAERRKQNDNDEEDMEMTDSNVTWKGPDADTNYLDLDYMQDDFETMFNDPDLKKTSPANKNQQKLKKFDLREKITSTPLPNSKSQQWRLMQPNVMNQRPAGMPPLIPQNSIQERHMQQRNNRSGNWTNNHNNNNGRRWGNQRNSNQQYGNRNGNGPGSFNNGNNNNMFNGGRVQRWNQRSSNQELLNKNLRAAFERLNRLNGHTIPQDKRDLTIEVSSDLINLTANPYPRSTSGGLPPPATVTMNSMQPAAQNLLDSSANCCKANDGLRALMGINDTNSFKTEMIPMLATKFLDFLQNGAQQTMHKPLYDMKIQKEIHEIQKKPLMYKCPGGEVVSSDGSGINNCEIIPRTSGISLNNRFA